MPTCECCDSNCLHHQGQNYCTDAARQCLVRVDMEDKTGTLFCFSCAEDAMESGVFGKHDVGKFIEATKRKKAGAYAKRT